MEAKQYSLREIEEKLQNGELPFSGITELGSSEFHFKAPAFHAGVSMHSGHLVRKEILDILEVSEQDRYREEDPYTDRFITNFPIRIHALDSRYEYELNRNPYRAMYDFDKPQWGMKVWKRKVRQDEYQRSLLKHREFHALLEMVCRFLLKQHRHALLFDMHSYCYQREKKHSWQEDKRPEINIGTGAVNREIFGPAISCFKRNLRRTRIQGQALRISENEVFFGGYLSRHLSRIYHERLLVLSIEYKKIFMNEWTGELYPDILDELIRDFNRAVDKAIESCLTTI